MHLSGFSIKNSSLASVQDREFESKKILEIEEEVIFFLHPERQK